MDTPYRYVAGLGHVRADPAVPAPHPEETLACQVVVCRGCCCGTESKHPDIDHAAQAAALTELAPAAARVRVSGCLGHCDSSNNIVIIPSRQGRAADGSVTWIGYALSGEVTAAVADWVRAGGPGVAAMPSVLSAHVVDRRARAVR